MENTLLYKINNSSNWVEIHRIERGYKIISFIPERGKIESKYENSERFNDKSKWDFNMIVEHGELEKQGVINEINQDENIKIDLMEGLKEIDPSVTENIIDAYLTCGDDEEMVLALKFSEDLDEVNKQLLATCIATTFITNITKDKEISEILNGMTIKILKD